METKDKLEDLIRDLPESLKEEVYDFVCFLVKKQLREELQEWNQFSLHQALEGLEQEELYTEADLKARW
jgi:hypothetical protein